MSLFINYSRFKINLILLILYSPSIAAIVVTSESQTAFPAASARMLSGFEEVGLIILSTINQPFSESCGFVESQRIILTVFLSAPALQTSFLSGCVNE